MASFRRRSLGKKRGVTLVEISVVIIIVSILAVIAIVGFRRHIIVSRMAEAQQMVGAIQRAQHDHFAERGAYANVSNNATSFYPNPTPKGNVTTQWGGPCNNCNGDLKAWERLAIRPTAPVMFGYSTISGVGGQVVPPPAAQVGAARALDISAAPTSTEPFFVITAALDYDRNGTDCQVTSMSGSNQIFVTNEGE
jgi:type IV pilus assembly protein PilA